jgi:hypothetical protein
VPQPPAEATAVIGPVRRLAVELRTELADLPDLAAGKAVIDRWVHELLAAGALDEATTDVFERLVDDWADRFRQRLAQDSLDQAAHADELQAEARAAAARAQLVRERAEREYAFALAALEAVRRGAPTSSVQPAQPSDVTADSTSTGPAQAEWPEQGAA